MKLPANPLTQALAAKQKQLGIWISLTSAYAAEVVAHGGFDWALIDMEHTPNDYQNVLHQLQAFAGSDTTAIVRLDWNDPVKVKRLLDLGAPGILFPMIQSVAEAEQVVAATRYPPRGVRGVAGGIRGNRFGRITDYWDRIEDETTVIVQIETAAAIEIAEDIGAVDGVSGVFFGPADISADIGHSGKPLVPEVWDLIRPAAQKLMARGVPVGTLVTDPDFAAELLNEGFTFVACGTDVSLLAKATDNLLAHVKGKVS